MSSRAGPFLFCPSLRPKLDYDGIDFVARPPGHEGKDWSCGERMMTCLQGGGGGRITEDGRENREGEVNPGRQGWLPVTMLDLC